MLELAIGGVVLILMFIFFLVSRYKRLPLG